MTSLAVRSNAPERMDTDCRDYEDYRVCLRDLARVGALTRIHPPVIAWLARAISDARTFSVLDIACGHGDLLRRIREWAARAGKTASLTGIDLNPGAIRAATEADADGIAFIEGDAFAPPVTPDFIVTSLFAHHLDGPSLVGFLRLIDATATRGWYIADTRRHWFPYYGFPLLARLLRWHRFVRYDGQVSVARAFTPADWHAALAEAGVAAEVRAHPPFRLNVSRLK